MWVSSDIIYATSFSNMYIQKIPAFPVIEYHCFI